MPAGREHVTNLNPGLQKGYALDFGSPVRYVAEALKDGPRILVALAEGYTHDPEELARVWDQELRKPRERRQVKGAQAEREAQAKRWLIQRALEALGSQVRREREHYTLTVDFDDLRVGGLPLPGSATFAEASAREASRPRAATTARRSRGSKADRADTAATATADNIEPEPASEVSQWLRANRYTPARLAKALEMDRGELERLMDGSRQPSRMVRLALWALERGADLPA